MALYTQLFPIISSSGVKARSSRKKDGNSCAVGRDECNGFDSSVPLIVVADAMRRNKIARHGNTLVRVGLYGVSTYKHKLNAVADVRPH